jgi:hypothetical protein
VYTNVKSSQSRKIEEIAVRGACAQVVMVQINEVVRCPEVEINDRPSKARKRVSKLVE